MIDEWRGREGPIFINQGHDDKEEPSQSGPFKFNHSASIQVRCQWLSASSTCRSFT